MDNPCRHIPKPSIGDLADAVLGAILGSAIVFVLYGSDIVETYGFKTVFVAGFFIAIGFLTMILSSDNRLGILDGLGEFMAGIDPNEILSECKALKEDRKLEEAYSLAIERAYGLFVNFFTDWIILGIANTGLIFLGPPHWFTTISIYAFSLFGFISFILWIISYLRYRDYSKRLFAIQLKKSDKAEISIKL